VYAAAQFFHGVPARRMYRRSAKRWVPNARRSERIVRFAGSNILFYDDHVIDLYHRIVVATAFARSSRSPDLSGSQSLYPKIVQLLPGSKLSPQPARLLATAGPGLRGIFRISIFRRNLRVRATHVL
jgi:hypothetical protein